MVVSGVVVVGNSSSVFNNTAITEGSNVFPAGGSTMFALPGPPGTWLPNSRCIANRQSCSSSDFGCQASYSACSLVADPSEYSTASVSSSACVGDVYNSNGQVACSGAACCSSTQTCSARTFSQPCEWMSQPQLVGQKLFTLTTLIGIEDTIPFLCNPGILGSADADFQMSTVCMNGAPNPQMPSLGS